MIGELEVIKLLLSDPRVDPSACENEAIRNATKNGHLEVVKLLLSDPRVDPSACKNIAFQNASISGNKDLILALLSHPKVDPDAALINEQTPESLRQLIPVARVLHDAISEDLKEMDLPDLSAEEWDALIHRHKCDSEISAWLLKKRAEKFNVCSKASVTECLI